MYKKYEDVILYLFFGGCTFLICMVSYYICAEPLGMNYMVANVISWVVAVLFAYITNRIFVFKSKVRDFTGVIKELWMFIACRLSTGVMEIVIMFVGVSLLKFNDLIVKAVAQVLVILSNYVLSKLLIFKKK
ncbi:MAG: GtrA family protein [Lachnospiraceae bacterium]|nr:GtrA family protein [Lachnospiraceae bacterium]